MSESDALGCPSDALVFPADTSQAGWRCLRSVSVSSWRIINQLARRILPWASCSCMKEHQSTAHL